MPQPAPSTTLYVLRSDDRTRYPVPPHGYLERIELRPQVDTPNMDASSPYVLVVDLLAPDGSRIPLDVLLTARDVVG